MANNYRRMRRRADMDATVAAKRLGVSANTINNWESGKTSPTADKLVKMAELYGCKVDELLALV